MKKKEMENKAVLPEELNEEALKNVNGGELFSLRENTTSNDENEANESALFKASTKAELF